MSRSRAPLHAEAPEGAVAGVEPVLQADAAERRRPSVVRCVLGRSRSSAGGTTTTGTRPPRPSSVTANCRSPTRASADAANVGEPEHVAQKLLDEIRSSRPCDGVSLAVSSLNKRLADTEIARDLVAQREAFRDAVVRFGLVRRPDAGRCARASPARSARLRR